MHKTKLIEESASALAEIGAFSESQFLHVFGKLLTKAERDWVISANRVSVTSDPNEYAKHYDAIFSPLRTSRFGHIEFVDKWYYYEDIIYSMDDKNKVEEHATACTYMACLTINMFWDDADAMAILRPYTLFINGSVEERDLNDDIRIRYLLWTLSRYGAGAADHEIIYAVTGLTALFLPGTFLPKYTIALCEFIKSLNTTLFKEYGNRKPYRAFRTHYLNMKARHPELADCDVLDVPKLDLSRLIGLKQSFEYWVKPSGQK